MDEKSTAKIFGNQLKKIRVDKGITQEKLALSSGLHPTYISHLETGKKQPTLYTALLISKSLGIKLDTLLSPFSTF